jgi:hypothetical protein
LFSHESDADLFYYESGGEDWLRVLEISYMMWVV